MNSKMQELYKRGGTKITLQQIQGNNILKKNYVVGNAADFDAIDIVVKVALNNLVTKRCSA